MGSFCAFLTVAHGGPHGSVSIGVILSKCCLRTETLKKELAALNKAHAEGVHRLVELIYNVRFSGPLANVRHYFIKFCYVNSC